MKKSTNLQKNLFLTGASGGIGKSIALTFKNNGYTIISPSKKELDLSDLNLIDSYFKKNSIQADTVIHCAGYNAPTSFSDLSDEELLKTMNINTYSFYKILKHLTPNMINQKKGKIVAISSLYGFLARAGRIAYVTSKHALNGMVKTLSIELGQHNIIVNSLSPGYVDTKMTRKNNNPKKIKSFEDKIPLNSLAKPEEIAETALFLCSDKNSYITGQDIIVDGGFSIGGFQS